MNYKYQTNYNEEIEVNSNLKNKLTLLKSEFESHKQCMEHDSI